MSDPTPVPPVLGEVIATGTAVNTQIETLGQALEKAAVDAINWCLAQGITDPEMILAAKHKAFRETRAAFEARGH
jgi:hypothetical protein